jgi:tyrosyl-tRNA synthetase
MCMEVVSRLRQPGPVDAGLVASGAMPSRVDARDQAEVLLRNAADVIPREDLVARLERSEVEGRPLRVKLGIDPSRPDLHLGHAVVLRKLREFQTFGHTAVLIVGDFTGRVGDPSGQSETRPFLAEDEIDANARTYLEQAGLVLDVERAELRRNSEWLSGMSMQDILRLASAYTVARMLERDDFRLRYGEGRPISVAEFLYPLMQAMDSVAIRADIEMGGTDQTFNLLAGRDIQRGYGQEPQVVFTMPLLEGTDGNRKMSKSLDNYVGLAEAPDAMFGKLMRVPDHLIVKYMRLCTAIGEPEARDVELGLADGRSHPMEEKRRMARAVVDLYHGEGAGAGAERRFDRIHRDREVPEDAPEVPVAASDVFYEREPGVVVLSVDGLLLQLGLAGSRSEARRLIDQGGVRRDGRPVDRYETGSTGTPEELSGSVWQVGRRKFARVVVRGSAG